MDRKEAFGACRMGLITRERDGYFAAADHVDGPRMTPMSRMIADALRGPTVLRRAGCAAPRSEHAIAQRDSGAGDAALCSRLTA